MSRIEKMMKRAETLAKTSTHHIAHVGAVVAKGAVVMGEGCNKAKTHPRSKSHSHYLHAEVCAIINVGYGMSEGPSHLMSANGSDLYVVRIMADGKRGISKPCETCILAMIEAGIDRVFYTDEKGETAKMPLPRRDDVR